MLLLVAHLSSDSSDVHGVQHKLIWPPPPVTLSIYTGGAHGGERRRVRQRLVGDIHGGNHCHRDRPRHSHRHRIRKCTSRITWYLMTIYKCNVWWVRWRIRHLTHTSRHGNTMQHCCMDNNTIVYHYAVGIYWPLTSDLWPHSQVLEAPFFDLIGVELSKPPGMKWNLDVAVACRLKSKLCGMCGDFNSDPGNDLVVGPDVSTCSLPATAGTLVSTHAHQA